MHPSNLVLAISLLAVPVSLMTNPPGSQGAAADQFNPSAVMRVQALNRYQPFTPAPVSPLSGSGQLPPSERAAGPGSHSFDAGPVNGTPFSDTPSGTLSDGGAQVSRGDRTYTEGNVTPNLGK